MHEVSGGLELAFEQSHESTLLLLERWSIEGYPQEIEFLPAKVGNGVTAKTLVETEFDPSGEIAAFLPGLELEGTVVAEELGVHSNGAFESFATRPNDAFLSHQYYLETVSAFEAYDLLIPFSQINDEPIVVAVIDSGVDYTHPDLGANIFINDLENNGISGVDDDGNGFTDDNIGYDFVNGDNDPFPGIDSHGTAVAGIIGAVSDNNYGIAGIASPFDIELLPVRALDTNGDGSFDDVASSIFYAIDSGADVINLSLGGPSFTQALSDSLAYAEANDVLVVTAAGNDGLNNDFFPTYPASFGFDNILSVAATDSLDRLAGFSNFGVESVDLAAPGVGILSTTHVGQFTHSFLNNGTSFAAPIVSGGAAALLASLPEHVTNATDVVIDVLLDTVRPVTGLQGLTATGGILDLEAASQALLVENLAIHGDSDNDTLIGFNGNDLIEGGNGNDILYGNFGSDLLSGGAGSDIFSFNSPSQGIDVITDFEYRDEDKIWIDAAGFGTSSSARFTFDLGSSSLLFDGTPFAVLEGLTSSIDFIPSLDIEFV